MNYTQQQIKRSNRKKTATIAFIGVMAVLLILGVFVATSNLSFVNAAARIELNVSVNGVTERVSYSWRDEEYNGPFSASFVGHKIVNGELPFNNIPTAETAFFIAQDNMFEYDDEMSRSYTYNIVEFDRYCFARANTSNFNSNALFIYLGKGENIGNNYVVIPAGYSVSDFGGIAIVSLPETPTAPVGKEFAGWYYDAAFTQAYQEGDIITSDTSLYAKFIDKVYTVTYVLNGSNHNSAQIAHGNNAENLAITVGTGKEFSGWYTDAACTQAFNFDTAITADTTLYGRIETIMCTVTFYVGAEVYATLNVPYGSTFQAYAASAAADAATAQAILNVYNLGNFDTAAAIETDTEVTATMNEGLLKWNNFGVWFMNNWKWLIACVGLLIVVIVGSVITAKRR